MTLGNAQSAFLRHLVEETDLPFQIDNNSAWEAVRLFKEEVDNAMFPPCLFDALPDPFLIASAMAEDGLGSGWLIVLVEHPREKGYIGWIFYQHEQTSSPAFWIFPDGSIKDISFN
ncbi:hypothetical protein DH09_10085 [Bacillaceae bacterium JMAK1]|nr:hypothetical protein DH09_10085 [Bacillaceae bacterium JMAK1]